MSQLSNNYVNITAQFQCPIACSLIYEPVCGPDQVTYGNPCLLQNAFCDSPGITGVPGECGKYNFIDRLEQTQEQFVIVGEKREVYCNGVCPGAVNKTHPQTPKLLFLFYP